MAGLQAALPELQSAGAAIVGISTDDAPESLALRRTLGLQFPLLNDPEAEVAARYGVRMIGTGLAVPAVFVVDPSGAIVWRHVGETVPDRPTPEAILEAIRGKRTSG